MLVRFNRVFVLFVIIVLESFPVFSTQVNNEDQLKENQRWEARWIAPPNIALDEYGVFHFRKKIVLDSVSEEFPIFITADNRYRLFVNGEFVNNGPAKSDVAHWYYDELDIALFLKPGTNIISVVVWNFGKYKAHWQMSNKTGLLVQGVGSNSQIINTNSSWKVYHNLAYKPSRFGRQFTVTGPGDRIDGALYPVGFEKLDFDDSDWKTSREMAKGSPLGTSEFSDWGLVPRPIPQMERKEEQFQFLYQDGIKKENPFLRNSTLTIPENTSTELLFDRSVMTLGYPTLNISGGAGARIELFYAEALKDSAGVKGNRNNIEGKDMVNDFSDLILVDGKFGSFTPLWKRAFRFVKVKIDTKDQPLEILDFYSVFSAYPLKQNAKFKSSLADLERIWDVGWRTLRLCADETYMDCPYYEQLQYIGDTRIQALITMYVDGDTRLMKNALMHFYHSMIPEGLTQSRYPSYQAQLIPTFSLVWVYMVHDYWMYSNDDEFVEQFLPSVASILDYYKRKVAQDQLLGPLQWWNFVDWSYGPWNPNKPSGGAPQSAFTGGSSVITLQYVLALQKAAELYESFDKNSAQRYREQANTFSGAVKERCWDENRMLLAESPAKKQFSQHANIMGILAGLFDNKQSSEVLDRMLAQETIPVSYYFSFYLFEALYKSGNGDQYLDMLDPWREMLDIGLSTFAETPEPTRSDVHAWSASPNYHFLSLVCGIRPMNPGFTEISIKPAFGDLKSIDAKMPHRLGTIKLSYKKQGFTEKFEVLLPPGTRGKLDWKGKSYLLEGGQLKNLIIEE